MQETWSIVLKFEQPPSAQGNPSVGYAKFLAPDALNNKLVSGAQFELYEGSDLVARVKVL